MLQLFQLWYYTTSCSHVKCLVTRLLAVQTLPNLSRCGCFLWGVADPPLTMNPSSADMEMTIICYLSLLAALSLIYAGRSSTWGTVSGGPWLCLDQHGWQRGSWWVEQPSLPSSAASPLLWPGVNLTCRLAYSSYYPGQCPWLGCHLHYDQIT